MRRCFVSPSDWHGERVVLSALDTHHLVTVLRAGVGDPVTVCDGQGREVDTRLASVSKDSAELELVGEIRAVNRGVWITLVQALPKGRKMDLVVEKATELGVSEVIPVTTARSVPGPRPERLSDRNTRWQRISVGAAKQCGTPWLPEIKPITGYAEALTHCRDFDLFLVATLETDTRPLKTVLDDMASVCPSRIAFLIGPEGDLVAEEVAAARMAGAVPVGLGDLVLRAETAALYVLSVLAHQFR